MMESQMFFIYDHTVLQQETDLIKDAIIYFFPSSMSELSQWTLCGQLIGALDFFKSFTGSPPVMFKLEHYTVVTKHLGRFTMALAGKRDDPSIILQRQLDNLYRLFTFYHHSFDHIEQQCKSRQVTFTAGIQQIWDCYLPFIKRYGDNMAAVFETQVSIVLPKTSAHLFLKTSFLLKWCEQQAGVLKGCVVFKGRVLCSHVTPELTAHLLILRPQQTHLPCTEKHLKSPLPDGVRIITVYLEPEEYNCLDPSIPFGAPEEPETSDAPQDPDTGQVMQPPQEPEPGGSVAHPEQIRSQCEDGAQQLVPNLAAKTDTNQNVVAQCEKAASQTLTAPCENQTMNGPEESAASQITSAPGESVPHAAPSQDATGDEESQAVEFSRGISKKSSTVEELESFYKDSLNSTQQSTDNVDDVSKTNNDKSDGANPSTTGGGDAGAVSRSSNIPQVNDPKSNGARCGNGPVPELGQGDADATIKGMTPEGGTAILAGLANCVDSKLTLESEESLRSNGTCESNADDVDASRSLTNKETAPRDQQIPTKPSHTDSKDRTSIPSPLVLMRTASKKRRKFSSASPHSSSDSARMFTFSRSTSQEDSGTPSTPGSVNLDAASLFRNVKKFAAQGNAVVEDIKTALSDRPRSGEESEGETLESKAYGTERKLDAELAVQRYEHSSESCVLDYDVVQVQAEINHPEVVDPQKDADVCDTGVKSCDVMHCEPTVDQAGSGDTSVTPPGENNADEQTATEENHSSQNTPVKDSRTCATNESNPTEPSVLEPKNNSEPESAVPRSNPPTLPSLRIAGQSSTIPSIFTPSEAPKRLETSHNAAGKVDSSGTPRRTRRRTSTLTEADVKEVGVESRPLARTDLYIQGNSDMLLMLFMEEDACADHKLMENLWKTSLPLLGELDAELKQCPEATEATTPHKTPPVGYSYLQYDSYLKKMSGQVSTSSNPMRPLSAVEHDFCECAVLMHEEFEEFADIRDITLRSHTTSVYGHRTATREVYYQNIDTKPPPGLPKDKDPTLCIDVQAYNKLWKEQHVHIV